MQESVIRIKGSYNQEQNKEQLLEQLNIFQKELQSVRYDAEFLCKQFPNENTHAIQLLWYDKLEEVQVKFKCMQEGNKQFIQINGFGKFKNMENMIEYCVYCQKIQITHQVDIDKPQVIFGENSYEIRFPRDHKKQ